MRKGLIATALAILSSMVFDYQYANYKPAHAQAPLPLTLSFQPVIPYLASVVAQERGFFKDAGLNVALKVLFRSDLIRSGLESGEIHIGSSSTDSLIRAHVGGFDHKLVYPAVFYDPKSPDAFLVVRADLPVKTARELEGKTIAATFGSIAEAGVKAWLRVNGANVNKIRFVEVRYPDMLGALETKRIDAAHIVDPFFTAAMERGIVRVLGHDLDVIGDRFLVACYIAKESWLQRNPEKAKRFVQAMEKATRFIVDKPDETLPILVKMTRVEPELASKLFPKRYVTHTIVKPEELQSAINFSAREKFIDEPFDFKRIVSSYAPVSR
jgi:NitT/TauT family transport system substrate-binding protein